MSTKDTTEAPSIFSDGRWTFDFECEWLHLQSLTLANLTFVRLPHIGAIGYHVALMGFVFTGTYVYDTKPMEALKAKIESIVNKHKDTTATDDSSQK